MHGNSQASPLFSSLAVSLIYYDSRGIFAVFPKLEP